MLNYFRGMTMRAIRNELMDLGVALTDTQFNTLTYAELNSIGRKAFKVYKLNHRIGSIIEGTESRNAPPLESDNTPSIPDGEFR